MSYLFSMDIIDIGSFSNYIQANITLAKLQNEGVECYLRDEATNIMLPPLGNAGGGIRLSVAEKDLAKAKDLMEVFKQAYLGASPCPKCGAKEIAELPSQEPKSIFTAIATWLFSNYAIPQSYEYVCGNCGWRGKELPEYNDEDMDML